MTAKDVKFTYEAIINPKNLSPRIPDYEPVKQVEAGDPCPASCGIAGAALEIKRGIEVGHVFQLGTKYSESMNATCLDEQGNSVTIEMGCYGIGVTRIVGAAIEQHRDAVELGAGQHRSHRRRKRPLRRDALRREDDQVDRAVVLQLAVGAELEHQLAAPRVVCDLHRDLAEEIGVTDDDWVYVESHNGRIKCQVRTMNGVERNTVWTWNAIGKRRGAWHLDDDAAEGEKGFLLNHLISELLPAETGGRRMSNSDPVTGQAAWFDLRVKITRAEAGEERSEPQFEPLEPVPGIVGKPKDQRFGEEFLPAGSWRRKQS